MNKENNKWMRPEAYRATMRPIPEIDLEAFPIAKPMPERDMNWISRRWTLCQILRELYHVTDDPELKLKIRIASTMAKAMATAISEHEPNWGRGRWPWREKI